MTSEFLLTYHVTRDRNVFLSLRAIETRSSGDNVAYVTRIVTKELCSLWVHLEMTRNTVLCPNHVTGACHPIIPIGFRDSTYQSINGDSLPDP